jgi:hypothetical protein
MVRLWHCLVRLWHRLSWIDCLRLVALGLVTGVTLIVNLPLNVSISDDVLYWFQDHERYSALLSNEPQRAYLDGLSAAVLPALVRRDPRELVEALDRAQGGRFPGIEPRFVILELRDGTILTSSDARRFPAGSLVVPNKLRRSAGGILSEPGTVALGWGGRYASMDFAWDGCSPRWKSLGQSELVSTLIAMRDLVYAGPG